MPTVFAKSEVPGTPEAIFDFLADYRNIPRLQSQFQSVTLVSENERGQGATMELRGHFHGMPLRVQHRIITYNPPERIVSISEGTLLSRTAWELHPLSGAHSPQTEVSVTVDYKMTGPMGGLFTGIASSLFHKEIQQMTDDSLRRLREIFAAKS